MRSLRLVLAVGFLAGLTGCADRPQLLSVTAVSPTSVVASATPTPITVTGTQFNKNMSVVLGGTGQPTTFVSPTTLTANVPANLAVGTYSIGIYDNEGGLAGAATLATPVTLQVTAK